MEALLQLIQNEMVWVVILAGLSIAGVPVYKYVNRAKTELARAKTEIAEAKETVEEVTALVTEIKDSVKK